MRKFLFGLLFVSTVSMSQSLTADEIIKKYVDAIGGQANIGKLKNVVVETEMENMGVIVSSKQITTADNKLLLVVSMEGQGELNKIVFDGEKAKISSQQGSQIVEGEGIEYFKFLGSIIPDLSYSSFTPIAGDKEKVGAEDCYTLSFELGNGLKFKDFYSVETGLKLKQEMITPMGSISYLYGAYKEYAGVKFPMDRKQEMQGQVMDTPVIALKVNQDIPDSEFSRD